MRSFIVSLFLTKYHPKDQIQEDKMGSACGTYGEEEEYVQGFGWETWRKEPTRKPGRTWEENIKMDLYGLGMEGTDWINLVQDRDKWRVLVKTVMKLQVL